MSDSQNILEETLTRDDAINQIIVSIAMEEIALSHIINTEGEKLQSALGTLEGSTAPVAATIQEVLAINKSVRETLDSAAQSQMVLKGKLKDALSASTMQGPEGPEGPRGPQGIQGEAGTVGTIKGSYDTIELLKQAHSTGQPGDFYYVKPDLYVWDADANDWVNVGQIAGPQGIQGEQGQRGEAGPQGPAGLQGPKGDPGPKGEQGPEASSFSIIPFASQMAPKSYANAAGNPTRVTLLGFGYFYTGYDSLFVPDRAINLAADGSFQLTDANGAADRQAVFSLPFDMKLNSVYITVGNWGSFLPLVEVYPHVQIYWAPAGSNSFKPIAGALAMPTQSIGPGAVAADQMREASVTGLSVSLPAGTRIAIGGLLKTSAGILPIDFYLYFTGGIGFTRG